MADLDWPAVLRAVRDRLGSIGATATAQVGVTVFHACNAVADEIERQQRTAQEPATVSAAETAEVVRPSAPAPASNRCVSCQREVGPPPGWHVCGPQRASEPVLSPADVLSGAEEMLRRIAATACLDLDATEAAAIVAELDRLRALCDEVSAQNTMVRHERDEARRERDAAETRSADVDDRLVEYGWSAERAAVCAYLRADGSHLTADALERGEHIVKEKA